MSLDLDAIKARLAAACPGPWTGMAVRRFIDGDCLAIVREHPEGEHKSEKGTTLTIAATLVPQYGDNDTATMLLHSRADMDALVAEVERLWCRVDDLERAREFVRLKATLHERAAVVAWLRHKAAAWGTEGSMSYAADLIEDGEHRAEEKP